MYTTQSRVESFLKRQLNENEVDLFGETVDYISSIIDSYTGRSWLPLCEDEDETPEAEERVFDGTGKRELFIDDFSVVEKIVLTDRNGNEISTLEDESDWLLYPFNATNKQSIRLRNSFFPMGDGNIIITAVWGSGDVPTDIIMVCTALVGNYLSGMGDKTGEYKSESIEGYSYTLLDGSTTDEETQELLKTLSKWKKITL